MEVMEKTLDQLIQDGPETSLTAPTTTLSKSQKTHGNSQTGNGVECPFEVEKAVLSIEPPQWYKSIWCGECALGLISHPKYENQRQLALFAEQGWVQFCGCGAGHRTRASLNRIIESFTPDAKHAEQARTEAQKKRSERFMSEAGIPPLYREWTLAGYIHKAAGDAGKNEAIAAVKNFAQNGGYLDMPHYGYRLGIVLWGKTRVGKTGALTPLFREVVKRRNITGYWVSYAEMISAISQFTDEAERKIDMMKRCDLLMIDDMFDPAAKRLNDRESNQLYRLIDHRVTHNKAMLITSNVDMPQVGKLTHERMQSRLEQSCAVIEVTGAQMSRTEVHG